MNDLLLRACRREPVERPPVWLMRQAGRSLPEYRALRARVGFLDLIAQPALAAEATIQPVDRLAVDAAIVFSDILVVPQAMGMELKVEEGVGPWFPAPLSEAADFARLRPVEPEEGLAHVLDAIRLTRRALDHRAPVIGFAGGPWTLACYMIEGRSSRTWSRAKRLLAARPDLMGGLLALLATTVGRFLQAQVRAGAQVVQIFESWAGAVGPADFREFVLPHLAMAARLAREAGAPVIVFAPGAGWALELLALEGNADVVGIDWQTDPADARRRLTRFPVALQGNLDPAWLHAPLETIRDRTRAMLEAFGPLGYVANLGHGVLPDTPVEHILAFVETVKGWR